MPTSTNYKGSVGARYLGIRLLAGCCYKHIRLSQHYALRKQKRAGTTHLEGTRFEEQVDIVENTAV